MAKGLVTGLLVGSHFSDCLLLRAKEQGLSQDQEGTCCFLMCLGEAWPTAVGRAEHRSGAVSHTQEDLWFSCISLTLAPDRD